MIKHCLHRFFKHGGVQIISSDSTSRQVAFQITMPASIVQTISPPLLGAGVMDQYLLANPVAVWIPPVSPEQIIPNPSISGDLSGRINSLIQSTVKETLELFRVFSSQVENPSDLIPMLPLGVYVTFRFRCCIDDLVTVMSELERTMVAGVAEFRFALASAMAEALSEFGSVVEITT